MKDIIGAELFKWRKSSLPLLSTCIVLAVPILLIIKDLFFETAPNVNEWMYTVTLMNSLVLSIMSGFFITFLMQKEYQDHTVINILTASVSRVSLMVVKLLVWMMWYVVTLALVAIVILIGYRLLYPDTFSMQGMTTILPIVAKNGGFLFVTFIPLLWVTVRQRTLFYPSIFVTLIMTVIALSATQTSAKMLKLALIVPWSSATLTSLFDLGNVNFIISLTVIFVTGIAGFGAAVYAFLRQDQ